MNYHGIPYMNLEERYLPGILPHFQVSYQLGQCSLRMQGLTAMIDFE